MTMTVRILGNDFTLPDEVVAELGWKAGDVLRFSTEDGRLVISRAVTDHDRGMAFAHRCFAKYRQTFEAFAKT